MLGRAPGADVLSRALKFRRLRGFTLVELMITVTVLSILILAAAPSLRQWIVNTRVRTSAEALQNGLRLAQSEAVRQSRQVLFGLTNAAPNVADVAMVANGLSWTAQTVPNVTDGGVSRFLRGGPVADTTSGVTIAGPQAVCFSSLGNLVANTTGAAPGALPVATGATCAAGAAVYNITHPSSDRPLGMQLQVSINGRVRMCDPARTLSATVPDGC